MPAASSERSIISIFRTAEKADAVVLIAECNEYRALDLVRLKRSMKGSVFVDLRNVYKPNEVIQKGFSYTGVGTAEEAGEEDQ